jgi:hypothetical protein
VRARNWPKAKDESNKCSAASYGIGEQSQRGISVGKALGHDAGADYGGDKEQSA